MENRQCLKIANALEYVATKGELSVIAKLLIDKVPKDIWLTQDEIASFADVPRKKVKYALRDLKKHQIIHVKRDISDLRKKKYILLSKKINELFSENQEKIIP
ncbi:MAG: hypothetical protein QXL15_02870 [Candidatus Korarchaeota archaeon]